MEKCMNQRKKKKSIYFYITLNLKAKSTHSFQLIYEQSEKL